MRAYVSKT